GRRGGGGRCGCRRGTGQGNPAGWWRGARSGAARSTPQKWSADDRRSRARRVNRWGLAPVSEGDGADDRQRASRGTVVAAALSVAHPASVDPSGLQYDELYRAHHARVLRLCRLLLGDPDEAEDVGQEAVGVLFRACQSPRPDMAWGPWLTRVTVHACRDRRRSRWWRRWWMVADELDEGSVAAPGRSPEGEVLGAEQRRRIWRAFDCLATRQREVFVLRHVEGWS